MFTSNSQSVIKPWPVDLVITVPCNYRWTVANKNIAHWCENIKFSYFDIIAMNILLLNLLNQYVKFQASCMKIYKRLRTINGGFPFSAKCRAIDILRSWLITMRYISLHFTWRISEHGRSRWAKERGRKRAREGMQHVRTAYLFFVRCN